MLEKETEPSIDASQLQSQLWEKIKKITNESSRQSGNGAQDALEVRGNKQEIVDMVIRIYNAIAEVLTEDNPHQEAIHFLATHALGEQGKGERRSQQIKDGKDVLEQNYNSNQALQQKTTG